MVHPYGLLFSPYRIAVFLREARQQTESPTAVYTPLPTHLLSTISRTAHTRSWSSLSNAHNKQKKRSQMAPLSLFQGSEKIRYFLFTSLPAINLSLQAILIPVEQLPHSVLNLHLMRPTQRVQLGDIDKLAHGAVGFGGVEFHLALEAHGLYHQI